MSISKTATVRAAILALVGSFLLPLHANGDGARRAIAIPSGELAAALELLAKQSGSDLVYRPDQVQGLTTAGVAGELSAEEALSRLLEGTPLTVSVDATGAILIALPATSESRQPSSYRQSRTDLEEIVVTGTNIRGARPTAPVVTITSDEMRLSGHANLGEAVRALPQNFSGGQNPTVGLGASGQNANYTGSSSFNLRGLGSDATLTLLNGARLPYDGLIQATDVSSIPVAAIDRVEVLLDGASAIYGSDAIGGVANIVLKRDFDGAEVSARYAAATDGGFEQHQYSVVAGTGWSSGGFIATAEFSENNPIYARQRDYLAAVPNQNVTILPDTSQQGVLVSGYQSLGDHVELVLDAFYTDRDTHDIGQTVALFDTRRDSIIWGVAPAVLFDLPREWSARLHGAKGRNTNTNTLYAYTLTGDLLQAVSPVTKYINDAETLGVTVEGPWFDLPGGATRLSLGAGYRTAEYEQVAVIARTTLIGGSTRSRHVFGEINLPLAARFTVNAALRYEDYDTFGDVTTPKIGFIWGATDSFDIKASWGKSFKAPTLTQLYEAPTLYLYPGALFPGLAPDRNVMFSAGGDPQLQPERAEVITAGFVVRPEALPGFSLEVSWFDIDYTDRVVMPITNLSQITDPAYAQFVLRDPSVEQQNQEFAHARLPGGTFTSNITGAPYDPANVSTLVRGGYANASADRSSGVDVTARQVVQMAQGQLALTANVSWIDATRELTSGASEIDAAGAIFFPAKFKGRVGASWSRSGLTLTGNVNHIGSVRNTSFTPNPKGASMTTLDLIADYRIHGGPLDGTGINIAVINAFDREPPYLRPQQDFFMPYDSTNYSAIGRTVGATLTKRF